MPSQTLLSFRAGKMSRENETSNTVVPDVRKGYIQLVNEDELLHFQWKERSATNAEDDLIIFPEDAKFVRVQEAGEGRVYMLRFESSKAKHFFWMQDKSDSRDAYHVERLNTLIDDPNAPPTDPPNGTESNAMGGVLNGAEATHSGSGSRLPGNWDEMGFDSVADSFWDEIQRGGIGREDLIRMFTGDLDASAVPIPTLPDLSRSGQNQSRPGPDRAQQQRESNFSLNDVLTRDVLNRVLQMPGIGERLRPGMPENWEQSGSEDVSEVVQRPEFQQALGTLSAAISTGQLAPLLQQFGLEGGIDNVEAFLRAVEEQVRREQQGGGSSGDQDNNEDRMQED